MSADLYEPCPFCGGEPRARLDDAACVACNGRGFIKIGLTAGQVERMAALELAGARAWLGDSGIDGPDRYTVRRSGWPVQRFPLRADALRAFGAPNP